MEAVNSIFFHLYLRMQQPAAAAAAAAGAAATPAAADGASKQPQRQAKHLFHQTFHFALF